MISRIIDIAFSGFWNFCGIFLLLALFGGLIVELTKALLLPFKRGNVINNYWKSDNKSNKEEE